MIKNSISRITKRRQAALARRQDDLLEAEHMTGQYNGLDEKVIQAKVDIIETDIANLNKKGVR